MFDNVLVILVVVFGIFVTIMLVLLYAFLRKHYNNKHINDDYYIKDLEREDNNQNNSQTKEDTDEFVPKKKK